MNNTMTYTLPKGTLVRINGTEKHPDRVKPVHLVLYETQEDVLIKNGMNHSVPGKVIENQGTWHKETLVATFREGYDEIVSQNNRQAAALFLTRD